MPTALGVSLVVTILVLCLHILWTVLLARSKDQQSREVLRDIGTWWRQAAYISLFASWMFTVYTLIQPHIERRIDATIDHFQSRVDRIENKLDSTREVLNSSLVKFGQTADSLRSTADAFTVTANSMTQTSDTIRGSSIVASEGVTKLTSSTTDLSNVVSKVSSLMKEVEAIKGMFGQSSSSAD